MAGSAVPFTLGFAFRKGDIPSGQGVVASGANLQVTVKNRWPDGSVKFAVLAGRAALGPSTSQTVTLSPGAPTGGAALTTADLRTTGVTAGVGCGTFGSASWSGADWDSPFASWVSGPEMSSWIYRKAVGSDAHLVAWLEVRLYASGAVEVLPWVENGYLRVPGAVNKSATYSFDLGGTQRFSAAFDLPNRCRTPLISGGAVSHWLGTDPLVTVKHDTDYLQATRLVPTYRSAVPANAGAISALPTQFQPLQQGNYPTGMGAGGYHPSIGMLPEWDVLYLKSTSSACYAAIQFNAYSAGRFGIHFRDESTHRPIRFSSYPNLVIDGGSGISGVGASTTNSYAVRGSGTAPATWASSHQPSVGYLAYLVTGRWFFMEEVQFAATLNFLKNGDSQRRFSAGVFRSDAGANTTRGAGWAWRTLAQAACATPDDDPLAAEFLASLQSNIAYYHARYVAQANNPFGFVTPYSDYSGAGDGIYVDAGWMQDFIVAAVGYSKSLDLGISSTARTQLDAFFAWKARSVVGRFGGTGASEYLYRDAATYTIAVAPSDSPDFGGGTGPWHADWGAVYRDTFSGGSPGTKEEGGLRGGNFPDATSYWGNLQPALAYAVEHGVPGAAAAYRRMVGASNWASLANNFAGSPVWGVRPPVEP